MRWGISMIKLAFEIVFVVVMSWMLIHRFRDTLAIRKRVLAKEQALRDLDKLLDPLTAEQRAEPK